MLRTTLTLRRSAFALLIAFVTFLLAGTVVGFAAAADHPWEDPPATFGVASPRVGDFVNYTKENLPTHAPDLAEPVLEPYLSYSWQPPQTMRDGLGGIHNVNVLESTPLWFYVVEQQGKMGLGTQTTYVDSTTGDTVAFTWGAGMDNNYPGQLPCQTCQVNVGSASSQYRSGVTEHFPLAQGAGHWAFLPLCGALNALQGTTVDLERPFVLFDNCAFQLGHIWLPRLTFRAVATDDLAGHESVVFRAQTSDDDVVFAWFESVNPYPLQLALLHPNGTGSVLRLNEFRRGSQPLAANVPPDPLGPLASLEWKARTPWGFDESGISHPFPLSEAYRRMIQAPDLQQFLKDHPGAFVRYARYSNYTKTFYGYNGGLYVRSREWNVVFEGGTAWMSVGLAQDYESLPTLGVQVPVVAPDQITYRYHNATSNLTITPAAHLPTALAPRSFPTLSSLEAEWHGYTSDRAPLNEWGFEIGCGDAACRNSVIGIHGGHANVTIQPMLNDVATGDGTSRSEYDELVLDRLSPGQSAPPTPFHWVYRWAYASQPLTGALQPQSSAAVEPTSYKAAVWAIPRGAYVAGAGVLAVLVGLVYWLWPSLKSALGLGFFSRFEGNEVLRHPARQQLLALVEANPGIHFAEISRRLELGHGNADHHLRQLVDKGLLIALEAPGYVCYYAPGKVDARAARALPWLKSPGARQLLAAIGQTPGRNGKEIAHALGLSEPTVHYHVKRLVAAGAIEARRVGRSLQLFETPSGAMARGIAEAAAA